MLLGANISRCVVSNTPNAACHQAHLGQILVKLREARQRGYKEIVIENPLVIDIEAACPKLRGLYPRRKPLASPTADTLGQTPRLEEARPTP